MPSYEVLSHSGSVPPSSCDDVDAFLCALARIAASDPDSLAGEEKAAAGLFDFSQPFFCTRAPGVSRATAMPPAAAMRGRV